MNVIEERNHNAITPNKEVHWKEEDAAPLVEEEDSMFATPASTIASPRPVRRSERRVTPKRELIPGTNEWVPKDGVTHPTPSPLDSELRRYHEEESIHLQPLAPRFIEFSSMDNYIGTIDVTTIEEKDTRENTPRNYGMTSGDDVTELTSDKTNHCAFELLICFAMSNVETIGKDAERLVQSVKSFSEKEKREKAFQCFQSWVHDSATALKLDATKTYGRVMTFLHSETYFIVRDRASDSLRWAKTKATPHAHVLQTATACLIAAMAYFGFEILVQTMSDVFCVPPHLLGCFIIGLLVLNFAVLEDAKVKI